MRELKFRAWSKYKNSWVMLHGIESLSSFEIFNGTFTLDNTGDWIWQQYTGLKDKNGKEIYEGDIMNVKGEIGVVEYDENNVCFVVSVDIDYNPCIGRYEVIGNIYENPELLEGIGKKQ